MGITSKLQRLNPLYALTEKYLESQVNNAPFMRFHNYPGRRVTHEELKAELNMITYCRAKTYTFYPTASWGVGIRSFDFGAQGYFPTAWAAMDFYEQEVARLAKGHLRIDLHAMRAAEPDIIQNHTLWRLADETRGEILLATRFTRERKCLHTELQILAF